MKDFKMQNIQSLQSQESGAISPTRISKSKVKLIGLESVKRMPDFKSPSMKSQLKSFTFKQ